MSEERKLGFLKGITGIINYQNIEIMNDKNLAALKKNLEGLGFKDRLHADLEKNITAKNPEFVLKDTVVYNNRTMESAVSFKAGKENDMYFLNRYQATLKDQPERTQTFYLDRGNGVTNKEAFNLLEGRAVNKDLVNKEGQEYNAWVQLDFSKKDERGNHKMDRYHENYNYDIQKEVGGLVLRPMSVKEYDVLFASLKKGNLQSAEFLKDGQVVQMHIAANPKERTIDIYDKSGKKLDDNQKLDYTDVPAASQKKEQGQATGTKQEQPNPGSGMGAREQKKADGDHQQKNTRKTGSDDDMDSPLLKKKNNAKRTGQRI